MPDAQINSLPVPNPSINPIQKSTIMKTPRRTLSPVASTFVPSPSPSPFPTPPSLSLFYEITDNYTSPLRLSPQSDGPSNNYGQRIYTACHLSDDLIVRTYNKATLDPSRGTQFISRATFPPYPSRSHQSLPNYQPSSTYNPDACANGYATDDSIPSLVSDSVSSSTSRT
jgi:hypothetical protein